MRKITLVLLLQSILLAQAANALTVTLDQDYRSVGTINPDNFGADFSYLNPSNGAYQYSTVPQQVDANSYSFAAQVATYTNEYCTAEFCGGSSTISRYGIKFAVDEDATLDLAFVFDTFSGNTPLAGYRIMLQEQQSGWLLDDRYNPLYWDADVLTFDPDTFDPIAVNHSIALEAGGLYELTIGFGPGVTEDGWRRESLVGFDLNASITAVPIPAAAWLFGSALAGLGWLRRKQTI